MKQRKDVSIINILGFTFAISICMAIGAYILHEYSYDRHFENSENIYRLYDQKHNYSSIDYRAKKPILETFPEVKNACLFQLIPEPTAVRFRDKGFYIKNILSADNAFFELFSIEFVDGYSSLPLMDLHSVVLSESASKQIFGEKIPIGQEIILRNRHRLTVTGIIKDFPDNSSIQANLIVNAENDDFKFGFSCEDGSDKSTYRWPFRIYLQLNDKTFPEELITKMNHNINVLQPYVDKAGLLPLTKMYLYDHTRGSRTKQGNRALLNILLGIALLILSLAVINYINLTVSQQFKRSKEIGIKKTIGANKQNIFQQFITESLLVTILAFTMAVLLLLITVPIYKSLFFPSFNPLLLLSYPNCFFIIFAVILLALFMGLGTALIFSSITPLQGLNKSLFTQGKKSYLKNALTVFQFMVSIALICSVVIIQKQIHFVKHSDPGFQEEQLVRLDLPQIAPTDRNNAFLLLDKFKQYSGIKSLSLSSGVPGKINFSMGSGVPGKKQSLKIIFADSTFKKTFGLQILKGRDLLPGEFGTVCLLNEEAYRYFAWDNLDNKRFNNGRRGGFKVIGVVNNFHYSSFHTSIEPMAILYQFGYPTNVSLRIAGHNISGTMEFIQKTWAEILPGYPLTYQFYDEWFDTMYRQEEKFAKTISFFAFLAIVISCIGILGLMVFSTERRTKEIGVRKVVGASVNNILLMLTKDFSKWILLANIIAWPIAWYAMNKWLQNFAYRVEMSWWVFVLAGTLALAIAVVTVSWQAIRAATANPVEALRYE